MQNNLQQATKKSIYENKVQQLDGLGTDINEFLTSESLSIAENLLGDFIQRVQTNINQQPDMVVTGKISNLSTQIEESTVNLIGNRYIIYQDMGVNGSETQLYNTPFRYTDKMPPVDVFVEWITTKNIQLRDNEKYYGKSSSTKNLDTEKKINQAAWEMATNVFKYGFKPRNIFAKEIPKLVDDLKKQIGDFTINAIANFLDISNESK